MASFFVFDIIFLIVFTALVILFLYKNRKNLQREGWIFMYRTNVAVRLMESFSKRFSKILLPLRYVIIALGYILMISLVALVISAIIMFWQISPDSPLARVPAVVPLIPYFPNLFGVQSLFPPFSFTYFLIAIAIVAFVHEFSHGIFMKLHKLKIKSTGVLFLGPILGAFVEEDKNQLQKTDKLPQMSILGAGVFANLLTAAVFAVVLSLFFSSAFAVGGMSFTNDYPYTVVPTAAAAAQLQLNQQNINPETGLVKINVSNQIIQVYPEVVNASLSKDLNLTWGFLQSPALEMQLAGQPPKPGVQQELTTFGVKGAITEINGIQINSVEQAISIIRSYEPEDVISLTYIESAETIVSTARPLYLGEEKTRIITLGNNNGTAFLGIKPIIDDSEESLIRKVISYVFFTPIRSLSLYYESKLGEFGIAIYYLLWWIVLINVFVAIFNMIPAGIFDGGRFFYLTLLALTNNNRKTADKIQKWVVRLLLIALALLILKWLYNILIRVFI